MAGRLGTAMGTQQVIGAHTGTGRQCTDTVETGIGADWLAHILHTGMGSGGLVRAKSGTGLPTSGQAEWLFVVDFILFPAVKEV